MTAIVMTRSYLEGQRRLIIARALAASIAAMMPVPFLDDWAIESVLGGGYRRIAAAHGGSVHCEDRAGGGACFVMQLPLAPHA